MKVTQYDVIIVGAGPVGLSCAASLAALNLKIALLEKEPEAFLRNPQADGREIAHTHASMRFLKKTGILAGILSKEITPIKEAKVLDGSSQSYFLNFTPKRVKQDALGFIISNHLVRKAAYDAVKKHKNIHLFAGVDVKELKTDEALARVVLSNGQKLQSHLIVAADGRFSGTRRRMSIPVSMNDFGRTVIVCRFEHTKPHHGIAYECFNYEQTLAMLPLKGNMASAVITLPTDQVGHVMQLSPAQFARDIEARFNHRFGALKLIGKLHTYPLVATYAQHFTAERFALIGDAAVGMHPVTAHGFNFGLKGAEVLTGKIAQALDLGLDLGSASLLNEYHKRLRAATLPLYMMTNALVRLYTAESSRAKLLRQAGLHLANLIPPVKKLVTDYLADSRTA